MPDTGECIDPRLPWVRSSSNFEEARALSGAGPRLRALKDAGARFGDQLRGGPRVLSVDTLPLTSFPYPTKRAFDGALRLPLPYVLVTHRALLVTFEAEGETRRLLFNPTQWRASLAAPFFRRLVERFGPAAAERLRGDFPPLLEQLAKLGIAPEQIDILAFDHFHSQDLRPLLGCEIPDEEDRTPGPLFPNALLLAPRVEWESWDDLHPVQRAWYVADGKVGVPSERVVLTDADLSLGDGLALVRTPGHTLGNQTLFAHHGDGVFGCSENGVSADAWTPYESRLPGLPSFARGYDLEVVRNANSLELGAEQYTSMMLEREIVDRVGDAPAFVRMFPSSEVTPSLLAPGVFPSQVFESAPAA
ncbi:MAG: hypothetical protein GXP55_02880 [Deltaproteobacteria bacterium]|nr:hypothetical protein [Deltaproteobacteria bacterium]